MKKITTLVIAMLLLSGCARQVALTNDAAATPDQPRPCTMEAKICPDNSAVGRTGPNCEFTPCPAVVATATSPVIQRQSVVAPIVEFHSRITKKFFGTYVTPQNSPIQPEKFKGYHTGVDIEYGDVTADVSVVAIADGTVVFSGRATGYGGVMAIRHVINDKTYVVVYGHLDPSRLITNGKKVAAGQKIGFLGQAYSTQTDGERRHLHFGIHVGSSVSIKGYVQTQVELNGWVDPLSMGF